MGYAISWIAIKGLSKAEIYKRLCLTPTGEIGDVTELNGAHTLDNDWTVVVLDRMGHPLVLEAELRQLSRQADVVACNIEEHTMFSSSEAWKDGDCLWRIVHEASTDLSNLEIDGNPPAIFASIEQEYRVQQAAEGDDPEVDHIFEIPLALAASITGFKQDETDIDEFELLDWQDEPMLGDWRPKAKPWWQFWK